MEGEHGPRGATAAVEAERPGSHQGNADVTIRQLPPPDPSTIAVWDMFRTSETASPLDVAPATTADSPADEPTVQGPVPDHTRRQDDAVPVSSLPAPGELNIKHRRSWKTWQLATAMVIALLFGMLISYKTSPTSDISAGAAGHKTYAPPPPSSPSGGTAPTTTAAGANASTTSSPAASGASTTNSTTTTTAGAGAAGQVQTLVPRTQSTGNWTSPAFTITGGTWYIGWAFQCTPVPASGPSFQIYIVPNGSQPSGTAAVTVGTATGQAISPETSTGPQQIVVQAPAGCVWVAKVTGVGSA